MLITDFKKRKKWTLDPGERKKEKGVGGKRESERARETDRLNTSRIMEILTFF